MVPSVEKGQDGKFRHRSYHVCHSLVSHVATPGRDSLSKWKVTIMDMEIHSWIAGQDLVNDNGEILITGELLKEQAKRHPSSSYNNLECY